MKKKQSPLQRNGMAAIPKRKDTCAILIISNENNKTSFDYFKGLHLGVAFDVSQMF